MVGGVSWGLLGGGGPTGTRWGFFFGGWWPHRDPENCCRGLNRWCAIGGVSNHLSFRLSAARRAMLSWGNIFEHDYLIETKAVGPCPKVKEVVNEIILNNYIGYKIFIFLWKLSCSCGRMVIAVDCKSIGFSVVGSIPTSCIFLRFHIFLSNYIVRGSQIGKALVFDTSTMGSSPIL